ncbi:MAG: succinate dehydrogenase cytochrome b subunit [FCB group bacterium]|nr:succinate dehydrogenase cytochrome b subunit [FCB group bacterium]
MNWFFRFMNSSVGKKIIMATTGLLLCSFLIIHLFGNLFLYGGPELFNTYVERLASVKPLIRVIEVLLALIFLFHILNSLWLTLGNRKANPVKYDVNRTRDNSSFFSRYMGITGSIIFIFLAVHLSTFWYKFQIDHEGGQFYRIVTGNTVGFNNPYITGLYILAMILLGFHLRHGFQSAFQTFGIRYNKYGKLIEAIAVLFWFAIPLGFVLIPIYFGLLKGGF